jgi:Lrp/AsnC family leucine-responsive transcriptional regulator
VISGYVAQVDAHQLGKDITAFIGVSIEHPRFNTGFAKKMVALPEVLECHRVAGEYSYLLKIKTDNTASLDHFISELLRTIPGVTRSQTTIVLASVKESTRIEASQSPSRLRVIGRSKEGA